MTDYTPTTLVVRSDYAELSSISIGKPRSESADEFDRWFDDEIRKAKAEAWAEGLMSIDGPTCTVWVEPDGRVWLDGYEQDDLRNPYVEES